MSSNVTYEHLLSKDPIGAFEKIKADYIRYFEHGYKVLDTKVNEERIKKLKETDSLYKEPYLELLPEYLPAEGIKDVKDLASAYAKEFGSQEEAENFFKEFIKNGLMSNTPYRHQVEMLEKAFKQGKNTVITSGTGSGKTESFLLPLLAQIYKEAKTEKWPKPKSVNPMWYRGDKNRYKPAQRSGEKRKAALRALILYPMNALVEDQVRRLRMALDSDEVRSFLDSTKGLNGNRIYFGRYNGNTIGSKSHKLIEAHNSKKLASNERSVCQELNKIFTTYSDIKDYYNALSPSEQKKQSDAPYISTRLDTNSMTSEMVTRWDMQNFPPDIMITNVSMLSIMLMRSAEKDIIKKTREWIEEDTSHVFQLVIDELHLYRGTAGSETACLVRMFLDQIGVPLIKDGKPNLQLRILCSSASLGDTDEANEKYLEEFFGVYNEDHTPAFEIQKGYDLETALQDETPFTDYSHFAEIKPDFVALSKDEQFKKATEVVGLYGSKSIKEFVDNNQKGIFAAISKAVNNPEKETRSCSLSELLQSEENEKGLFCSMEALRGFLIFRGYVDTLNQKGEPKENGEKTLEHRLPRIRFHQFFKYLEGLWGELQPTVRNEKKINDSPIANVSYTAHEVENGHKVLELLRCESCGEMYIGGNRKHTGNGVSNSYTMTLNFPDLEKIPSFNPTPMVQNKSYEDYVIFWPTFEMPKDLKGKDNSARLTDGNTDFKKTNARASWVQKYLDPETGELCSNADENENKELIKGFVYQLNKDGKTDPILSKILALPCACPKCGMYYGDRKYVKSPIRSFRTGIDRSNQLLSKELIYQLSENSNKLIGFSDSREDAAKQAYGIEKEQYRDMVRMLFVQCVDESADSISQIKNYIDDQLAKGLNEKQVSRNAAREFATVKDIDSIIDDILNNNPLDKYKKEVVPMYDFICKDPVRYANTVDGRLSTKLVKLGINPAGVEYRNQYSDIRDKIFWNQSFDFNTGHTKGDIDNDYAKKVKENLQSAIFANSFGKYMGVTVLDSGIGYICCNRNSDIENSPEFSELRAILPPKYNVYDFVDAFIRIMGDNFRYQDPEEKSPETYELYEDYPKEKYQSFINRFGDNNGFTSCQCNELGIKLNAFIQKHVGKNAILEVHKLGFRKLQAHDIYYECENCHRIHPNLGMGICTRCGEILDGPVTGKTVQDLWNTHFISYDIITEPREPRRLHTEELTGQTDDIQERLLQFKDMILVQDPADRLRESLAKSIDMVNVTTTMEVGVDIGSLEAIFQGNMPPTRYNYQQRVGRGGRRGQAFSTAFTFCRGRSHDVYYYTKATDYIVGGAPAAPTLSLAPFDDTDNAGKPVKKMKQAIMKRVVIKNVIKEALKDYDKFDYDLIDTAGEFGRVSEWESDTKNQLKKWICDHPDRITDIINYYFGQFNEGGQIQEDLDKLATWIAESLIPSIDKTVENYPDPSKGLAQCLSETGYLPMYGLPSDSRDFYHGYDYKNHKIKSIDRSLEMSISEYAPGSEKTKDKGKYMVAGFTSSLKNDDKDNIKLFTDDTDALKDRYIITFDKAIDPTNNNDLKIIRVDNVYDNCAPKDILLDENQRLLVTPLAYRSYKIKDNYGKEVENSDRRSTFSQPIIYAQDDPSHGGTKEIQNVSITAYGTAIEDESYVWHINTKNNEFFTGKYNTEIHPQGDRSNFMFYDKYDEPIEADNSTISLAIGCRKPTEMIKLQIKECSNEHLNLKIGHENDANIRAAFLSAAFLIQRNLADLLDVQPEEIEISEHLENETIPAIYLSDALPNGAGLVSYLYQEENLKKLLESIVNYETNFMKTIKEESHERECLTACQHCLLTFSNRGYHHILDWRLGVEIIKLMLDPNYDFNYGLTVAEDQKCIWTEAASKLGINLEEDSIYGLFESGDDYGNDTCMIITHPLWDKKKIAEEISKITDATQFEVYDTFKLLRSDLKHKEFNIAGLQEDPDDADEHVPAVAPIIDPDEFSTEEDDDDEPM